MTLEKRLCQVRCYIDYTWTFQKYFSVSMAYRNFPKFSDRQVKANSADQDQTALRGAVWSGSTLFAIPSASFGCITLRKRHLVQLLGWLQQSFWVSEYLGNLRYFFYKKISESVCTLKMSARVLNTPGDVRPLNKKRDYRSLVASALASGARGPGFDPCDRRGKIFRTCFS